MGNAPARLFSVNVVMLAFATLGTTPDLLHAQTDTIPATRSACLVRNWNQVCQPYVFITEAEVRYGLPIPEFRTSGTPLHYLVYAAQLGYLRGVTGRLGLGVIAMFAYEVMSDDTQLGGGVRIRRIGNPFHVDVNLGVFKQPRIATLGTTVRIDANYDDLLRLGIGFDVVPFMREYTGSSQDTILERSSASRLVTTIGVGRRLGLAANAAIGGLALIVLAGI